MSFTTTITLGNEILRRYAPQNDIAVKNFRRDIYLTAVGMTWGFTLLGASSEAGARRSAKSA